MRPPPGRAMILSALLGLASLAEAQEAAGDEPPEYLSGVPGGSAPRWFKGNLHTHSLWSDGNDYPEMIVDWYVRAGYQFLALSDHNTLGQGEQWIDVREADGRSGHRVTERYARRFGTSWVDSRPRAGSLLVRLKPLSEYRTLFERPGRFLLLQGEEITDRFEGKPIHLNASNLVEYLAPRGGSSVVDTMERNLAGADEQSRRLGIPILTHLNHPNFGYAITPEELAMVRRERFFEVYNGHPDVHQVGDEQHPSVERMWDIVNTIRIAELGAAPVFGIATDDSHNYFGNGGASPGRGWIMVRSRLLSPERLIRAMQLGDFYASTGVELRRVRFDPRVAALEVEVHPRPLARFTIEFVGTLKDADATRGPAVDEQGVATPASERYSEDVGRVFQTVEGTRARYEFRGDELYVRAVVTSSLPPANPSYEGQRARAWTQPVGWRGRVAPEPPIQPTPMPEAPE